MKLVNLFPAAAALLATVVPLQSAQAAVIYTFRSFTEALGQPLLGSFSYTSPNFITTNRDVPTPTNCMVIGRIPSCGDMQYFWADRQAGYDVIGFSFNQSATAFYYFPDGAFRAFGTYGTVGEGFDYAGILKVSPIPEPATWAMMLVGFAAIGATARRRRPSPALR